MSERPQTNLPIDPRVHALLESEAKGGTAMTRILNAAVYWFYYRLDAHQRELARLECGEWLDAGEVPDAARAMGLEISLRTARELEARRLKHKKVAGE